MNKIPRENALAFFPAPVTFGDVTLRPLTLGDAVRISELGVDIGQRIPRELVVNVADILSASPTRDCDIQNVCNAVETTLNAAFATYLQPFQKSRGPISLNPNGLGWPLEYAEFLCSEYGWSWQNAIDTPVVTVFALAAANLRRNGGEHKGFDYIERAYIEEMKNDG